MSPPLDAPHRVPGCHKQHKALKECLPHALFDKLVQRSAMQV